MVLVNDLSRVADELGQLRAQIKVLKVQADGLRAQVLAARLDRPVAGRRFTLRMKQQKRRVFLRDKLPAHILNDPQYWRETQAATVVTEATTSTAAAEGVVDDFDVFEPF